jgi:PadR family transcriptional regulator
MSAIEPLGEFEQVVLLAILRLDNDAYAVTIRDEICAHTGRDVSRGSVYITLDRLEKRYYALRPRAVEALRENRRALVSLWRGIEEKLA